jgi:DNA-binding transcriptional ArsR family regulator
MSAGRVPGVVLILTDRAVELRSTLEPTAWLVLEEMAMSAHIVDGVAVSKLSVRTLADRLGRSKDAMARALRNLSGAGLIERLEERDDFSGRFVSVHYCVDLRAAGLRLPSADVGPSNTPTNSPSNSPTHTQRVPPLDPSGPPTRGQSLASAVAMSGGTSTPDLRHLPPPPSSPTSTDLHRGAAPGPSRTDPDRRDTAGTHGRARSRPDPARPDTLWHDTDRG